MIKLPKNILSLSEAAKKYGFSRDSLKDYVRRGRLEAVLKDGRYWTTDAAIRRYMKSRDSAKIPKRYRKKR
jgi:predicted site-specific integrase-resolvase